jgi:hypothetical protein
MRADDARNRIAIGQTDPIEPEPERFGNHFMRMRGTT